MGPLHADMMAKTIETLPILIAPDPILKARARPVTADDMPQVRALLPRMFVTMYRAPGIGLAAPQVHVGSRI
jgi:peptide deformylase